MSIDLQAELQTTLGAGYRVTRELPGGGMSRVFVAEDATLEREIVVKLLPPELMAGLNLERFRTEIQHAVRLQHPHIVPVLSAGLIEYRTGARGPYYTMPFIRGETLRARLEREGSLPHEEVRRILMDVADALAHAHEAGIVHRDIKPDNVFLVGKNALVADFGVSKALQPTGVSAPVTGVGMTLGTPGYMSPEQASGDRGLDHRADIYSVGVLAYELLSGQRPFRGVSFHELLVAQAVQTPVPLLETRPDLPAGIVAVVMRCLEKRPEDRWQSAHELLTALEALGSGSHSTASLPVAPPRHRAARWQWLLGGGLGIVAITVAALGIWRRSPAMEPALGAGHASSVALLPPDYFDPDSVNSALLADLVDHVSNNLGRVEGLTVVNYLSAGALYRRGAAPTLRDVGEQLGVEHLVVFQSRATQRGLRLSVQFIEAPTMAQVWVAPYSPDSSNFDQVVADVVSRVSHTLVGVAATVPAPTSARVRREGAHAEFLAGKQALRRRTPDGIAEALRHFEQAVRLDSTHAEAVGRLATALGLQLAYGYRTTLGGYPTAGRALGLAERAVGLDPEQAEPVGFLAYIEYLTLAPVEKVEADFQRAIRLRASEADVAGWHALLLLRQGKTEESLTQAQRAIDLDPMSSARHLGLALPALALGRIPLALLEARRAGELEPDLRRPRQVEGLALLLLDRAAECVALDLYPYLGVKAACLQAVGRAREARALVDSLQRLVASESSGDQAYSDVLPVQELAIWHAWTGNAEETLTQIRLAYSRSPTGVDPRILKSTIYDRVRGAPGFAEEVRRLQDGVWPRVLEQRQRIQGAEGTTPLSERGRGEEGKRDRGLGTLRG
ncbi:MAG TPA: protein kinase [Gemmatimonadales bacterium]|nr:protein kinase [Gemmatimonadales bacterium]